MLRDEILPKTRLDDARKTFGGCGVDACSTDEALGARCWQGRSCGASECVCARAGQTKEGVRHFVGGCCQGSAGRAKLPSSCANTRAENCRVTCIYRLSPGDRT